MVVKGLWVVKSIMGSKTDIIGTKMLPIRVGEKAKYLDMDIDIATSLASRGILSVMKSYTNILTSDLGFVVEGKNEYEI